MSTSAEEFARISRTIAGGESSYARLRAAGREVVIARAAGATITDVGGVEYVDWCGGYGVNLFGHHPAFVWEAVNRAVAELGPHIAFPHRLYGDVGELVTSLVPSVEQLRFANSGTEATGAAVRLVRAATGRDLVLKFEGHYHGWADHLVAGWSAGSASRPAVPDSTGVPAVALGAVWTVAWNDPEALADAVAAAGDRLAGVVCEVVTGSGGLLEPVPGYLEGLCATVRAAGGLVVFDEVMTGFRLAPAGAQERYGVSPDVTVLGKVIGGGTALAAFGGSYEVMRVERENTVVHGGTYTGSPITLAAAAAVLGRISDEPAIYDDLERRSARLGAGIEAAFARHGVAGHVRRVGSMVLPVLSARPDAVPVSVADVAAMQDTAAYAAFCDALEERGVYSHRYALGRWFVSMAHDDAVIDRTLEAVDGAAAVIAATAGARA